MGRRHFLVVEAEEDEDDGGEGVVSGLETLLHTLVGVSVDPNAGRPSSLRMHESVITSRLH